MYGNYGSYGNYGQFGGGGSPLLPAAISSIVQWLKGLVSGLVINDKVNPLVVSPKPEVRDVNCLSFITDDNLTVPVGIGEAVTSFDLSYDVLINDLTATHYHVDGRKGSGDGLIIFTDNTPRIGFRVDSEPIQYLSITGMDDGEWHHVSLTWDGATWTFMFDALSIQLVHDSIAVQDKTEHFLGSTFSGANFFDGKMSGYTVIQDGATLAALPMEEGQELTAYDTGGSSNHATIDGATYVTEDGIPSWNHEWGFTRGGTDVSDPLSTYAAAGGTVRINAKPGPNGGTGGSWCQYDGTETNGRFYQTARTVQYYSIDINKGTMDTDIARVLFNGVAPVTATFNLATGIVVSVVGAGIATIEDIGGGWFTCAVQGDAPAADRFVIIQADDGTGPIGDLYLANPFTVATDRKYIPALGDPTSVLIELATHYDDRQAAVVWTMDDMSSQIDRWTPFIEACELGRSNGVVTSPCFVTDWTDTDDWEDFQSRLVGDGEDYFYTPANHGATHPVLDDFNYDDEYVGSRQTIYDNLDLPWQYTYKGNPYMVSFVQWGGAFTIATRNSLLQTNNYIVNRTTSDLKYDYAPWDTNWFSDPAFTNEDGIKFTDNEARVIADDGDFGQFDYAYHIGGVYHLYTHPWKVGSEVNGVNSDLWHNLIEYIGNRNDIWYAGFDNLYSYRYLYERATPTIALTETHEEIAFTVTASGTERLKYGLSFPMTYKLTKSLDWRGTDYEVYYKDAENPTWALVQRKTASDNFNAINCYRDNGGYINVSQGLPQQSDSFDIKIVRV